MTAVLAAAAGALAVLGAWEGLAAVERTRLAPLLGATLAPVARAGREGRAPTAPERRRLALVAGAGLAAAGWLAGGPAAAAAAALCGPLLGVALVRRRRRAYARELARGAAGVARAIADALAGGHAVRGTLAVAGEGMPGAAGHELRRTASALAMGASTEAALEALGARARAPAWDAMVAGILLQRDAGGDLTGLLRDLAQALEAAERADRDARVATAQARATARIVLALPAAAAGLAELASPGFLSTLLARPLSASLVGLALALQAVAIVAVRRVARAP
jgi:tight adherence protein B